LHASARYVASCLAAFALSTTAGLALGASGGAGELASLAATERAAVVELFASEVALARAQAEAERHSERERALAETRRRLLGRSAIARGSLAATHERIGTLLRRLYVEGEAGAIEVIFGARSLGAVLEGLDGLEHATRRNRELAVEALRLSRALDAQLAGLTRTQAALAAVRSRADATAAQLLAATARKRTTIVALQRRQGLTPARLEAESREAERAAQRIEAPTTSVGDTVAASDPEAAPATAARAGTRTLVVDAVAYHLPGRTASGLPVGIGVIAVDPTVIPLGTRVFVPGYGDAVAADVGAAIKGDVIDLWMPSTAAARAWGRRTVTVTVYG
jgi:3D (Asp-Asp-Asp) domain-containing protein